MSNFDDFLQSQTGIGNQTVTGSSTVWGPDNTGGPLVDTWVLSNSESTESVLDFDPDTDLRCSLKVQMPNSWDAGSITIRPRWISDSVLTTDVVWLLEAYFVSEGQTYDQSYDATTATVTDSNSGQEFKNTAPDMTLNLGWAAGDTLVFGLSRLGTDVSDTLAAIARLVGFDFIYNTNSSVDN